MIYFVACRETNAVKIGYAEDPFARFSKIQSDNAADLDLLAVEGGDKSREAELHAQFASHRKRGEWFDFAPPIRAYVSSLPAVLKPRRKAALGGALGAWLHEHELTITEFANMVGTSAASVSRFCAKISVPVPETMLRIYAVTNGAVTPNDFYDIPALEKSAVPAREGEEQERPFESAHTQTGSDRSTERELH